MSRDLYINFTYWLKRQIRVYFRKIFNPSFHFFIHPKNNADSKSRESLLVEITNFHNLSKNNTEAHSEWQLYLKRLEYLILNDDVSKFLQWDIIQDTMFVGNKKYIDTELQYLLSLNNFEAKWKGVMIDPGVGSPPKFKAFPLSSSNRIHNTYHLTQLELYLNINIENISTILEYGGGYGCLSDIMNKITQFESYNIYDLKEFNCLQKYYLSQTLENRKIKFIHSSADKLSDINLFYEFDILNNNISKIINNESNLFIANWSLSESPLSIRNKFISLLPKFTYICIGFQKNFKELDNIQYFNQVILSLTNYEVKIIEINHLPNNYYLFAKRI